MTPAELLEILEQRVTQAMRDDPLLWQGCGDGYNRAQRIGLWPMGADSVAALVVGRIQHPKTLGEDQMVVKIIDTRCDPGGLFLTAIANGDLVGDHLVEVLAYSHIDHIGIYIMEKLEPIPNSEDEYEEIPPEASQWLSYTNRALRGRMTGEPAIEELREWAARTLPCTFLDLHADNAMMRGDTYVILDPYGPYDAETTHELSKQEAPLPSGRTGDRMRLCA